jgi:hypothetical protein
MATQTVQNLTSSFVDDPELKETFADSIRVVWFDGNTWRLEVTATRLEPTGSGDTPPVSKQFPTCRLVLSAAAGLDLLNKLSEVAASLEKQGILKRNQAPSTPVVHH